MIARLTALKSPLERHLEGVRLYEDPILGWMRDATGFRGMLVLADRTDGTSIALTFWADSEAEVKSQEASDRFRELVVKEIGSTVTRGPERYEVVLADGIRFEHPSVEP